MVNNLRKKKVIHQKKWIAVFLIILSAILSPDE